MGWGELRGGHSWGSLGPIPLFRKLLFWQAHTSNENALGSILTMNLPRILHESSLYSENNRPHVKPKHFKVTFEYGPINMLLIKPHHTATLGRYCTFSSVNTGLPSTQKWQLCLFTNSPKWKTASYNHNILFHKAVGSCSYWIPFDCHYLQGDVLERSKDFTIES